MNKTTLCALASSCAHWLDRLTCGCVSCIGRKVDEWLTWSELNRISENAVLNVGYIGAVAIPVIAAYLARLGEGNAGAPYVEAFFVAYCASLSLAIGKILFFIGCPKIIIYYKNFTRYASEFPDLVRALDTIAEKKVELARRTLREKVKKDGEAQGMEPGLADEFAEVMAEANAAIVEADARGPIEGLVMHFHADWVEAEKRWIVCRVLIGVFYVMAAALGAALFGAIGFNLFAAL